MSNVALVGSNPKLDVHVLLGAPKYQLTPQAVDVCSHSHMGRVCGAPLEQCRPCL
jgi:hypothetical protein